MKQNRLNFLDLHRGWAIIIMIETHVFNELITADAKETAWFAVLNFINGLVAPSFLFVSGFVFVLAAQRKIAQLREFKFPFWKQLGRILLVLLIAYGLHVPYYSLKKTLTVTTYEQWLGFFQSDVLHCIAVSWIILFIILLTVKSDRMKERVFFITGLFAVLLTPFIWNVEFLPTVPRFISAYLNGRHYSIFPLFPWYGFLSFGAFLAMKFSKAQEAQTEKVFFTTLVKVGLGLVVAAGLVALLPIHFSFIEEHWRSNPLFFAIRLGLVISLMSGAYFYCEKYKTEKSFVIDVSRESLVMYMGHIMFIYRKFWNDKSIATLYGGTLDAWQCVIGSLLLIALMIVTAKIWSGIKQRSITTARVISYAIAAVWIGMLVIREY